MVNKSNTIDNAYYEWLLRKIRLHDRDEKYELLIRALHSKEFYSIVPNDDNRRIDGMKLRDTFVEAQNLASYGDIDGPCTMLEMLIALSERFESMVDDSVDHDGPSTWFWEIMSNTNLDKYEDNRYYDEWPGGEVDDILNSLLERKYGRDGKGGMFPLKDVVSNQRKIEIWYQLCGYILENYYPNYIK